MNQDLTAIAALTMRRACPLADVANALRELKNNLDPNSIKKHRKIFHV